MKPIKNESKMVALAAVMIMAAISALAEEKRNRIANSNIQKELTPVQKIVVSLQDCKLALVEGDRVVKIWDTAVGKKSTPSPSGTYTIVNRLDRPTYYHPGKVIPSGPSNPLGTRWLGLSLKGFGIHGTNVPASIGRKASHGCIRMRNQDIEELFELVQVGSVVELHAEQSEYLAQIFKPEVPQKTPVPQAPSANSTVSLVAAIIVQ
jgi:lipoprotein-anchoring transpeptidase ErfK/SrfK